MIPQIIELKNFLSYGEPIQRIDFGHHALICLSGKNGHGKSALLDALTWALWGQARKISGAMKADEGLLRLGSSRMIVSLEFIFGGATYRVRREFTKTYGRPLVALDFDLYDSATAKFVSLTEKTVKATQARIERLIGLDYETFINSAFIRQGQANEFSKKSAKERKQILATILGLEHYDLLQQRALEKAKDLSDDKKSIALLLEQYSRDLAMEEQLQATQTQEQAALATHAEQLEKCIKEVRAGEQALATCQAQQTTLCTLRKDYAALEQASQQNRERLLIQLREWKKTHAQLLTMPDLTILHEEKRKLIEQEACLMEIKQKTLALHERIITAKESHQKRVTLLTLDHDQACEHARRNIHEREIAYHNKRTQRINHEFQHNELVTKIAHFQQEQVAYETTCANYNQQTQELERMSHQFDKRKAFYQALLQRGTWIKNELTELEHKLATIGQATNPSCPLCEQLLTLKRKHFLAQQFTEQKSVRERQLSRINSIMKKLKERLVEQNDQRIKLSAQVEELRITRQKLETLRQHLNEYEHQHIESKKTLDTLCREQITYEHEVSRAQQQCATAEAALHNAIATDPEAQALTAEMSNLEQEKATLNFDATVYAQLQEQKALLDQRCAQAQDRHLLHRVQQERRTAIAMLIQEMKRVTKEMVRVTEQLTTYACMDAQEQQLRQHVATLTSIIATRTTEKERLLQHIGSLANEFNHLTKIKEAAVRAKEQITQLDEEIEDYHAIATAMSKNGIQALLIEEAIPEIEQEANALLGRLSDNRSQIFIESLKDLKSGGVKETLDIHITDSAGMRPYEMYSGGEAFRIDFALRIAIAKLLARRAGTALQTLIIDEGFGSQDEEGLSHIMDALYAIRGDFAKIIVVSHLPDFKHNFPVHFIVEKGPSGSVINIEERG